MMTTTKYRTTGGIITHVKWPSFSNIHKLIKEDGILENEEVLALEKIDGSNLGIEVDPSTGCLVALHGRNNLLWPTINEETKSKEGIDDPEGGEDDDDEDDPFDRRYGRVKGTLHPIRDKYLRNIIMFAKSYCGTQNLIVFGEWYHDLGQGEPVWYPFGLKTRGENNHSQTMTLSLYKKFLDHDLTPPKILFQGGTMEEAIDTLLPLMLNPESPLFEGVFFTRANVSGTRWCAKWKTGNFEEQPKFVLASISKYSSISSKLLQVYETRIMTRSERNTANVTTTNKRKQTEPPTSVETKALEVLNKQILLAFNSVMSKSKVTVEDILKMEKSSKIVEVKRINADTFADVMEQYQNVGEDIKENVPKNAKKICGKFVASKLMK